MEVLSKVQSALGHAVKVGPVYIKLYLLVPVMLIGTVLGSTAVYHATFSPSTGSRSITAQTVIVFVGGMNTSIASGKCMIGGFEDLSSEFSQRLPFPASFHGGCLTGDNMLQSPVSMAYFSYLGGSMEPNTGTWTPKPYTGCVPDQTDLADDESNLGKMLTSYLDIYPNAHFILIGHSLGGLVALAEASVFAFQHPVGVISKVITLDSPLNGVPVPMTAGMALDQCGFLAGHVLQNLAARNDASPKTPNSEVAVLQARGAGVYTLGNDSDCLYNVTPPCTRLVQDIFHTSGTLYSSDQIPTQEVSSAFAHLYHLPEDVLAPKGLTSPPDLNVPPGHGAVLVSPQPLHDILRYALAPVVTIGNPVASSGYPLTPQGISVPYHATIHCVWGHASSASAEVVSLQVNGTKPISHVAHAFTQGGDSLILIGSLTLPVTYPDISPEFVVNAGSDACTYPQTLSSELPTDSDYLGGLGHGVPITIDQPGCYQNAAFVGSTDASKVVGLGFDQPPGTPSVPFPSGTVSRAATNSTDSVFQYQPIHACVDFTSADAVRSFYSSAMSAAGWSSSSTFPYQGDPTLSCGDPYCWSWGAQGSDVTRWASLENVSVDGSAATFALRLAVQIAPLPSPWGGGAQAPLLGDPLAAFQSAYGFSGSTAGTTPYGSLSFRTDSQGNVVFIQVNWAPSGESPNCGAFLPQDAQAGPQDGDAMDNWTDYTSATLAANLPSTDFSVTPGLIRLNDQYNDTNKLYVVGCQIYAQGEPALYG